MFIIGFILGILLMCVFQINNDEVKLKSENNRLQKQLETYKILYRSKKIIVESLTDKNNELIIENEKLKDNLYNEHIPSLY